MQEFFVDYGLWLLIALLIVIGLVFLLGVGKKKPIDAAPIETPVVIDKQTPPLETSAHGATEVAEPVAPAQPAPAPVAITVPVSEPAAVSAPVDTPSAASDDLLKLKGVGPKLNLLLLELGVTRYEQIAQWSDADIATIDARLGNFKGRPIRDQWVDQARYLAAGDLAGFEAKYGKL